MSVCMCVNIDDVFYSWIWMWMYFFYTCVTVCDARETGGDGKEGSRACTAAATATAAVWWWHDGQVTPAVRRGCALLLPVSFMYVYIYYLYHALLLWCVHYV